MKASILSFALFIFFSTSLFAQKPITVPGPCLMYLDNAKVIENTLEKVLQWCELVPPTVMCQDGKVYSLEQFQVSFLSVKPFMNTDFGLGERGVPIKAQLAVKNGKPGDALVLKEVVYLDSTGTKKMLPVISIKLK